MSESHAGKPGKQLYALFLRKNPHKRLLLNQLTTLEDCKTILNAEKTLIILDREALLSYIED